MGEGRGVGVNLGSIFLTILIQIVLINQNRHSYFEKIKIKRI